MFESRTQILRRFLHSFRIICESLEMQSSWVHHWRRNYRTVYMLRSQPTLAEALPGPTKICRSWAAYHLALLSITPTLLCPINGAVRNPPVDVMVFSRSVSTWAVSPRLINTMHLALSARSSSPLTFPDSSLLSSLSTVSEWGVPVDFSSVGLLSSRCFSVY